MKLFENPCMQKFKLNKRWIYGKVLWILDFLEYKYQRCSPGMFVKIFRKLVS